MEDRPKLKSMTKNSMAHTCEPGISITASVNTMKARPVPDALWGGRWKEHELTVLYFWWYMMNYTVQKQKQAKTEEKNECLVQG